MSSFTHIGNIIDSLIKDLSHKGFAREIKIGLLWSKAVGSILSKKAQINKLDNNILFVNVENNIWLQELVLQKSKIIHRINKKLLPQDKIQDIIFCIAEKKINI
ncbi:MAG: DUF721 domain-containing protein [Candidatus Cloacimonadota bacterium]|nr:DUF721 domain-containing protein [Candidatus Cloacimonadota bacterium]